MPLCLGRCSSKLELTRAPQDDLPLDTLKRPPSRRSWHVWTLTKVSGFCATVHCPRVVPSERHTQQKGTQWLLRSSPVTLSARGTKTSSLILVKWPLFLFANFLSFSCGFSCHDCQTRQPGDLPQCVTKKLELTFWAWTKTTTAKNYRPGLGLPVDLHAWAVSCSVSSK